MEHKILIVDDEPNIFHALRRAMHGEASWQLLYAESGEKALEVLEEEVIDLMICDENMPGMNGTQLLGLVRQRWPDVIRMMLTGDASVDLVVNAVNNGEIYRFFTKPCNEAELIISVRDALKMQKLKKESRRLLETVKQQSAALESLKQGEGAEVRTTLAAITNKSPARNGGRDIVMLDDDDVDALLDDIRSELDKIAD